MMPGAVIGLGAVLFAEADGHHLEQAAFDLVIEIGMRFDPADHGDMVGCQAFWSQKTGMPLTSPTWTTSILDLISQPMAAVTRNVPGDAFDLPR